MDGASLLASKREAGLREATVPLDVAGELVEVTIRALPRRAYRELLDAHPPTAEDGADADWNGETFPPALIAASCLHPELGLEEATELWDEWEPSEAGRLFQACYWNNEDASRLKGLLLSYSLMRGFEQNSTIASPKESPTPSSSPGTKQTKTKS